MVNLNAILGTLGMGLGYSLNDVTVHRHEDVYTVLLGTFHWSLTTASQCFHINTWYSEIKKGTFLALLSSPHHRLTVKGPGW